MDCLGGLNTNNWVTIVRSEPWESTWRCHWCHGEYDHFHQAGYERLDTWAQMRDREWNGWHWHLKPMHRSTHHCTQPNTLRTSSAGMNMRFKTEAENLSSQKYQICKGNQQHLLCNIVTQAMHGKMEISSYPLHIKYTKNLHNTMNGQH